MPLVAGTSEALTVDETFGPVDLARVGLGMRALAAGGAVTATVPADGFTAASGAAMLRLREAEAAPVFAGFADGSALRTG